MRSVVESLEGAGTTGQPVIPELTDWSAGMRAKGEFRCPECGYGVTVYRVLPTCPMCQGAGWERVPWRPLTRSHTRSSG
jgi:hypothetical protein